MSTANLLFCGMRILLYAALIAAGSITSIAQQFRYEVYDEDHTPWHVHKERRDRVVASLAPTSVAAVLAADVRNRQNDVDFEYRQNSDLLYLTGCTEPGAVLLLSARGFRIGEKVHKEILFLRERNTAKEQWVGPTMGPAETVALLRIDTALPLSKLAEILDSCLSTTDTVFVSSMPTKSVTVPLAQRNLYTDGNLRTWLREKNPKIVLRTSMPLLAALREVKDTSELRLLQKAIDISVDGHYAMMRGARPGMREYELEALIEYTFKALGAEDVGYPSIVGSNYNACILHYTTNRRATRMGELVLADCGAEYHGYTADITRTFPLSGTFTAEQRKIYAIVLEAQDSGIAASRVGSPFSAPDAAARSVVARRLMELGITSKTEEASRYFMHGTSHYLGLDVHDPGTGGPLKANSVITVEPGIYIPEGSPCDKRWWNIGVRIEDDILVTPAGPINMSARLVRSIEEIEAVVGKAP